ncbi:MAG: O-antigen ligase family protein [Candidatus Paceibacterota bacterium]
MNLHKFFANAVVFAGFVAVPFIPFIVLGQSTFFPFITGKNFAFRALVEIMFSAWIVLAVIDPAYRPKKSYLLYAFAAFVGIITLASIFGADPAKSFWSNYERMEGVVTYFHLFAYFVVASTVLTVRGFWRPYLNFNLFAGVIMAIIGVMQWAGHVKISQGGIRIDGTLGNTEYLGTYALFNIFIALFLLVREKLDTTGGNIRMVIYGLIIILQTFALYHSGTRGAILGLIAGLGLATLLVAIFEKNNKLIRKSAIGIVIAIILFVGGFIAIRDASFIQQSPVLSRLAAISPTEGTGHARLMVWGMAYEGFKEKPILGWGMDNFMYVFSKYYDPNMYAQEQWFDRAHNVVFDWLVAGGALGLLGYLSLFGLSLYYIWRPAPLETASGRSVAPSLTGRTDELSVLEKSVLTGLLGGYFFQNLFVFDNITSLIYFGMILAYVEGMNRGQLTTDTASQTTDRNAENKSKNIKKDAAEKEDLTFMVSGGAFIFAIVLLYNVNYSPFMQNITFIKGLTDRTDPSLARNLAFFKDALAYDSMGETEIREQLTPFSTTAFDSSKGISDIQQQFLLLTKSELEKQAAEHPSDARAQLFAGSFLSKVGKYDESLVYLNKAAELSPTKQSILFELGNAHYGNKNTAKAEEIFKRAFELAPEYPEAKKFYLQVLELNGKHAETVKILKEYPAPKV